MDLDTPKLSYSMEMFGDQFNYYEMIYLFGDEHWSYAFCEYNIQTNQTLCVETG